MKPFLVAFTAAAVAAVTSGIVVSLLRDDAKPSSAQAASPDSGADTARRLDALDKQGAELAKSLDDLRMLLATKQAPPRVPVGEIEAAVARALEQAGAAKGKSDAPAVADAKKPSEKSADAKALFAEMKGKSWEDRQALWQKAIEAGVLDELIAIYEKNAADNPNDAKAQVDLGHAYIQKTMKSGGGPEAGVWSMKADRAYDNALGLDDHNWEARFSKAVNYSFWPPNLGKQRDAIAQFETLVKQQAGQPVRDEFAQTHLWLGNMYSQIGQTDKALAAWQAGLAQFPNDEQLQHQITLAQNH